MARKPAIVDKRAADLAKMDAEIARLKKLVVDKQKDLDADVAQHIDRWDHGKQTRLTAEIKKLHGIIDEQAERRFKVELGEAAEPSKPAAPVQHRAWAIENLPEPEYPSVARTAENHEVFEEAFKKFVHFHIDHKYSYLKSVGLHPDQRVDQELLATLAGVGNAHHIWLSYRCLAIEARLRQLEQQTTELEKSGIRYGGTYQRANTYKRGTIVTYSGSGWIALKDADVGCSPGESQDIWQLAIKKGQDGKDARS